jgi:hypothetical protein
MLAGLAGAALLAAAVSGAQLVPVLEFIARSGRGAGGRLHDIYPYSLDPVRVAELVWPNVFGTVTAGNRFWLPVVASPRALGAMWVHSLYLGGLTLVLALGAIGFRDGPPWRGWLSAVAIVSLVAALGESTSPLWWARHSPTWAARVGPRDPADVTAVRPDGRLRDGDGGVYWALATALPGFHQFRFPSKLLSFSALALSGLAGVGWDRLLAGRGRRRVSTITAGLLALSLLAGAIAVGQQGRIVSALREGPMGRGLTAFGPHDAPGTVAELQRALAHGSIVYAVALALVLGGARRPALAGAVALAVLSADLALANARHVITVPQALMDRTPRVVELIARAERAAGATASGPFRVHRMPLWEPYAWYRRSSPDRAEQSTAWEHDTIYPKYGLPYGLQYPYTRGVAELSDHTRFFERFRTSIDPGAPRRSFNYLRRSLDLWNTRYFVITAYPARWLSLNPVFSAFLDRTEVVNPAADGPDGRIPPGDWLSGADFRIVRNLDSLPRAWLVHAARAIEPGRTVGEDTLDEALFGDVPTSAGPGQPASGFLEVAWLAREQVAELAGYLPGSAPTASESVTVADYSPQRVVLDAILERPGLVVLADVDYPGWRLTIDGREAPVYRVNRAMRGAAVGAGRHRLVYTYRPRSFLAGAGLSAAGLAALTALGLAVRSGR